MNEYELKEIKVAKKNKLESNRENEKIVETATPRRNVFRVYEPKSITIGYKEHASYVENRK